MSEPYFVGDEFELDGYKSHGNVKCRFIIRTATPGAIVAEDVNETKRGLSTPVVYGFYGNSCLMP